MFSFTINQLIETVRELAKEDPDNIYKNLNNQVLCFYNKGNCLNGTIGCIFGQAFRKLGIDDTTLNNFEYKSIAEIISHNFPNCDRKLVMWCREVQSHQDKGYSWSESIKQADKYIEDISV